MNKYREKKERRLEYLSLIYSKARNTLHPTYLLIYIHFHLSYTHAYKYLLAYNAYTFHNPLACKQLHGLILIVNLRCRQWLISLSVAHYLYVVSNGSLALVARLQTSPKSMGLSITGNIGVVLTIVAVPGLVRLHPPAGTNLRGGLYGHRSPRLMIDRYLHWLQRTTSFQLASSGNRRRDSQ